MKLNLLIRYMAAFPAELLTGMDGEVWQGAFDFSLLRPLATQFLVSLRRWRLFALFDLVLGLAVLATAVMQTGVGLTA